MASFRRCLLALGVAEISEIAALQVGTEQRPRLCWKTCHSNADGIESTIKMNNLGGKGPNANDDERMVYEKVAHVGNKNLDLHVSVNPRSKEEFGTYDPWNSTVNGQHKCFGVVNVRNEESVMLDFTFHEHATGNLFVPPMPFGFTVFDVDHSGDAGQQETVVFNTPPLPGRTVVGADLMRDDSSHDLRVVSNTIGSGEDNPLDANGEWAPLPEEASRARAVDVTYKDEATWTVTFQSKGGKRGRNFLFFGCEDEGAEALVGDGAKRQKNKKWKKNKKNRKHKAIETDVPDLPATPTLPPKPDLPNAPNAGNVSLPPVPGGAKDVAKLAISVVVTTLAGAFA